MLFKPVALGQVVQVQQLLLGRLVLRKRRDNLVEVLTMRLVHHHYHYLLEGKTHTFSHITFYFYIADIKIYLLGQQTERYSPFEPDQYIDHFSPF